MSSLAEHSDETGRSVESELSPTALFEQAYRRYRSRAYYTACTLVKNREEALELVHDAFVRAYRAWDRFDRTREFYPWFHRILRNLCLNRLRSRKRNPAKESLDNLDEQGIRPPSHDPDPRVVADGDERTERLWDAISQLDESDREIILLREFHGLPYKAIAESMECPVGTVMSRLHSARKKLRIILEERGISL